MTENLFADPAYFAWSQIVLRMFDFYLKDSIENKNSFDYEVK